MDKFKSVIDRIRVIKGVNRGIITKEQIDHLFLMYELDEKEQQKVFDFLKQNEIIPIAEDQVPKEEKKAFEQLPEPPSEPSEQEKEEVRKKRFESKLKGLIDAINEHPNLLKLYEYEIPIFMNALADYDRELMAILCGRYNEVTHRIAGAIYKVAVWHVEQVQEKIGGCGTAMARDFSRFEYWLAKVFSEQELLELVNTAMDDQEISFEQMEAILIILHNVPTVVNSARSIHFSDNTHPRRNRLKEYLDS